MGRFRPRAQGISIRSESLRAEAIDQVDRGWLACPKLLDPNGRFRNDSNRLINVVSRFPAVRPGKIRAIDDLKQGLANQFCRIDTPIFLPIWDRGAELFLSILSPRRERACAKGDRASEYKNLPIRPDESDLCPIALESNVGSHRCGFAPKTHVFGSIADSLHYKVLPRVVASVTHRIFALPAIGFYDDSPSDSEQIEG